MHFLSKTLLWAIILQLTVGSVPVSRSAYAGGPGDPPKKNTNYETPQLKKVFNEIENADLTKAPGKTPDYWFLTQQYYIQNGKSYHVSDPSVVVDAISPDFDKVDFVADRAEKSIALVYSKNGKEIARHEIRSPADKPNALDVVHFVRDQEMIQFVSSDGQMYVIDLGNARRLFFNAPIPLFQVGTVDESIDLNKVEMTYLTRGVRPPDAIAPDAFLPSGPENEDLYTAGDLMIYSDDASTGLRTLHAIYSRKIIYYEMWESNSILATLAAAVNPQEAQVDVFLENESNPGVRTNVQASIVNNGSSLANLPRGQASFGAMDPMSRNALLSMMTVSQDQPARIAQQAGINLQGTKNLRDIFTTGEWKSFYDQSLARAKINPSLSKAENNRALQQGWQKAAEDFVKKTKLQKTAFEKVVDQYSLKMLSGIVLASVVTFGTPVLGLEGAFGQWGVHFVNELMDAHILPEVMKAAAYRVPVTVSMMTLASLLPITILLGGIYGKIKNIAGVLPGFVTAGIRAAAILQYPVIEKMTNALKNGKKFIQRNVINSIKSAVGLKVSDPLTLHQEKINRIRVRSYSWMLSHIVVADQYGIDLSTLAMAENRGVGILDAILKSDLKGNSQFLKDWDEVSRDLVFSLNDAYQYTELKDISEISAQDLSRDLALAKSTADKLVALKDSKVLSNLHRLKNRWKSGSEKVFNYLSTFGSGEYKFFREVTPTDDVVMQIYTQFAIDYLMACPLEAGFGERALLSRPDYLAAMAGKFGETNPAHLSDMIEQLMIYSIRESAGTVQVYQKESNPRETVYDPIELITQKGKENPEGMLRALKRWGLSVVNLKQANYGGMALKTLWKRLNATQMAGSMSVLARIFIGGGVVAAMASSTSVHAALQVLGNKSLAAALGYSYTFILGFFSFTWPWLVVGRGRQMYLAPIAANSDRLEQAKIKISQGLRSDNAMLANQGIDEMMDLYDQSNEDESNRELAKMVNKLENYMDIPEMERVKLEKEISPYLSTLIEIRTAQEAEDVVAVQSGYEHLKALYQGRADASEVARMDGATLLEYSKIHPPVINAANHLLLETTILGAAISTTILATKLFAHSYDPTHLTGSVFASIGMMSAGGYAALYAGQRIINRVATPVAQAFTKYIAKPIQETCEVLLHRKN